MISPMTDSTYLILLSLLKERHGYGIMKVIEKTTKGLINIGPASMYTILKKLEVNGDIHLKQDVNRKKMYVITEQGLVRLKQEVERRQLFVEVGEALLKGDSAKSVIEGCEID